MFLIGGWFILSAGSPLDRLHLPADQRTPSAPKELVWVIQRPSGVAPGPMRVIFSADGRLIVCHRSDLLLLWDVRRRREWALLAAKPNAVALAPDGLTLVHAEGGLLHVWDLRGSEPKKVSKVDVREGVEGLAFSRDGQSLWAVLLEQVVQLTLAGHDLQPRAGRGGTGVREGLSWMAQAPDGKLLAFSYFDGDLFLWDPKYNTDASLKRLLQRPIATHLQNLSSVDFSPDGKYLLSAHREEVQIWNVAKGAVHQSIKHEGPALARYSNDGRSILVWNTKNAILTTYDLASQKKLKEWPLQPGKPTAWAADGRHVATSDADGNVYIFRLPG
jgi:WD40 repeat protein